MEVRGLTAEQIEEALARANKKYAGNVRLYQFRSNKANTAFLFQVKVNTARHAGSRVSPERVDYYGREITKARRIASACWHVHRDFYREMFRINPDARITTALARYKGSEHFEQTYVETGYGDTGPFGYPIPDISECCNCPEGAYTEWADNLGDVLAFEVNQ